MLAARNPNRTSISGPAIKENSKAGVPRWQALRRVKERRIGGKEDEKFEVGMKVIPKKGVTVLAERFSTERRRGFK